MFKKFMPDEVFEVFADITPQFLEQKKIRALLLDIDNTLVTYDDPEPTEAVLEWIKKLCAHGIKLAFVSNNSDPERVTRFNDQLGFYAISRGKKPLPGGFIKAMDKLGVLPEETASVGDQIFTDVWAAKNAGVYAILVKPIKDKTTPFFKFKRLLEKPVLKKYRKNRNSKKA